MSVELVLRRATVEDADAIGRIHAEGSAAAYQHIFPPEVFAARTADARAADFREGIEEDDPDERFWVAERDGEVVGFALTLPGKDPDIEGGGELKLFYVEPTLRGGGIGLPLFELAVGDLRRRRFSPYLYTLKENAAARAWYERRGWVCDGTEAPWSSRGEYPEIVEVRYRPE